MDYKTNGTEGVVGSAKIGLQKAKNKFSERQFINTL